MAGRKTKLTPEVHERIVAYVRSGAWIETAAAACDISKVSLYDWLKRGARAKSGPFYEFAQDVQRALAQDELRCVAALNVFITGKSMKDGREVDEAIPPQVRLAALEFKMERKFTRWSPKVNMVVEEELRAFVERIKANLDAETFRQVLAAAFGARPTDLLGPGSDGSESG